MAPKKKLLKDIAYEKIKEKVLMGDDDYTSENVLVEELQMSRTPIREALQRLEHDGFIKILPNQGIAIPQLSVKEMNDIADYRIAIETASLKQAVHLLLPDDFAELEHLIRLQQAAAENNNVLLYLQHDVAFHLYLLRVVGNDLFVGEIENVSARLYRLSRVMKRDPKQIFARIEEHIRMIDLLRKKDIDGAVAEMERHLLTGKLGTY